MELACIDKMWGILPREAFPERIELSITYGGQR